MHLEFVVVIGSISESSISNAFTNDVFYLVNFVHFHAIVMLSYIHVEDLVK